MKKITSLIVCIAITFMTCKKENEVVKTFSSINVINAVMDLGPVKINPGVPSFSYKNAIDFLGVSSNKFYFSELGQRSIIAVSSTDTTQVVFKGNYNMEPGFYTLYIAGQAPNIDTLFRKEVNMPFVSSEAGPSAIDNVTFVRFVNLSPNSPALKVNVKNSTNNEVENFTYKSIGNWKAYGNKEIATTNYIFEIRNAVTNDVLLTYTFGATVVNKFKNVALVIKGLVGGTGTNAFGIFPANYYY